MLHMFLFCCWCSHCWTHVVWMGILALLRREIEYNLLIFDISRRASHLLSRLVEQEIYSNDVIETSRPCGTIKDLIGPKNFS